MQYVALITLCSASILLATQTPIVATDLGRLLLVAAITSIVVCSPSADGTLLIDRLLSAIIGGGALYYLVSLALGPVQYRMLVGPPRAMLEASRRAYRVDMKTRRAVFV